MVTVIGLGQRPANDNKFAPMFGLFGVRINGNEHRIISTSSCDAQLWALDYCEKQGIDCWTVTTWKIQ